MLGFPTCLWTSHSPWVLEEEEAKTDAWMCQTAKNQDVKSVPIPTSDMAWLSRTKGAKRGVHPRKPPRLDNMPINMVHRALLRSTELPWGPNTPWRELRMSIELAQKNSHLYFYYPLTEIQHFGSPHTTGAVFPITFSPMEIISIFMSQCTCFKYYISKYHLCSQPFWNCSCFSTCHRTCYLVHYGGKLLLYHTIF